MKKARPEITFTVSKLQFGDEGISVSLYADGVYQFQTCLADGPFLGIRLWFAKRFLRKKFALIGDSV